MIEWRRAGGLALVLMMASMGCSSEDKAQASPPASFDYPLDNELRINHLQAKGTHNSYHLRPSHAPVGEWDYDHKPLDVQMGEQGVRKVELDLRFKAADGDTPAYWDVRHIPIVDPETTCETLRACLKTMRVWSDANPAHHPVFIMLEIKGVDDPNADYSAIFGTLESDILAEFPRDRVITPDDVKGSAASVQEAATTKGWPTLAEGRGKVLFFLTPSDKFRDEYTYGQKHLDGRISFVAGGLGDPWAAIALYNDPVGSKESIRKAVEAGLIVRTMVDGSPDDVKNNRRERLEAGIASGAHILSTDFPAKVPEHEYYLEIPGGGPSRCNPLIAPANCTSEAVENKAYIKP